jgi:hypothetical protein
MVLYLQLQYIFIAWCLVKHRNKFIFTFIFCYGTDDRFSYVYRCDEYVYVRCHVQKSSGLRRDLSLKRETTLPRNKGVQETGGYY